MKLSLALGIFFSLGNCSPAALLKQVDIFNRCPYIISQIHPETDA